MEALAKRLVKVVPSERQLKWHQLGFYGFIHFGMNTFTESEWGDGKANLDLFAPTELDTDQWIKSLKIAGIKAAILTCKHHDGFCLWPSKYTAYSVKNSPYKEGKGDIVGEVAASCRKYGLKFGVYLSPWDRHDARYGDSDAYNTYFISQLIELLTEYGDIFSVWFDGACGEGPNGKRQVYDWEKYYEVIRKLQPDACIAVCGPDVRWCGNEAGHCRPSEWSVVPRRLSQTEIIKATSQQNDDITFREKKISSKDLDLGSREVLMEEEDLIWYPAEVDTSIRPGWFYHEEEDDKVKSLEKLLEIYYNSVGGNAALLLNIPPDKRGLIHEIDVERLNELGSHLKDTFAQCITPEARVVASREEKGHTAEAIQMEDENYYKAPDGVESTILTFKWENTNRINHIVLKEAIQLSQRIESFVIEAKVDEGYKKIYEGRVVGSCKICPFDTVETDEIRLKILKSRVCPTIQFVGIYKEGKYEKA